MEELSKWEVLSPGQPFRTQGCDRAGAQVPQGWRAPSTIVSLTTMLPVGWMGDDLPTEETML